jgi:hypothetical protein
VLVYHNGAVIDLPRQWALQNARRLKSVGTAGAHEREDGAYFTGAASINP